MPLLYESSLCTDFDHVTRCYRRMFSCVLAMWAVKGNRACKSGA